MSSLIRVAHCTQRNPILSFHANANAIAMSTFPRDTFPDYPHVPASYPSIRLLEPMSCRSNTYCFAPEHLTFAANIYRPGTTFMGIQNQVLRALSISSTGPISAVSKPSEKPAQIKYQVVVSYLQRRAKVQSSIVHTPYVLFFRLGSSAFFILNVSSMMSIIRLMS